MQPFSTFSTESAAVMVARAVLDVDPREKPSGLSHVIAVLLPEELAHHLLFARCAEKIHYGERHEREPTGKPVLQDQSLPESPEPDGGIHGMANGTVNAMLDQLMTFAQLQSDGPVLPQVGMRTPEKPQRSHQQNCPAPRSEPGQAIIRESQPGCEQINDRQQKAPRHDEQHQHPFSRIQPADRLLVAFRALDEHITDPQVNNERDEKNYAPKYNASWT